MVKCLAEFPLEQGGSVLAEVDEASAGPVIRRLGRDGPTLAERTDKMFKQTGVFITSAAAATHFKVSMTWRSGAAGT
jgi:hypothetical protein